MDSFTELFGIEVKEDNKDFYLGAAVVFSVVFILDIAFPDTFHHHLFYIIKITAEQDKILFLALACIFGYLYYHSGKKVILRIDREGIWTKKYDTIKWKEISYYYTTVSKRKKTEQLDLFLQLNDTTGKFDREVTVPLRNVDKSFDDIRNAVEFYAVKHRIKDMGA